MKKLWYGFLGIVFILALASCADSKDYKGMLEKKGYEIIITTQFDIVIKHGTKLGLVQVDTGYFASSLQSDDFIEYIHWLPYEINNLVIETE